MKRSINTACRMLLFFVIICGLIYPLFVTGLAQAFFPHQASGSLLYSESGTLIGSELVGQKFSEQKYFWSRPSAIDYNAQSSGASNLGATSQSWHDAVNTRKGLFTDVGAGEIPAEMVTASGSGLDPHISPEGAMMQASRVAAARGVSQQEVEAIINQHIEHPTWGLLGESVVNVLRLNLALDKMNR